MRPRSASHGFTLLETLVAFLVLALALSVLMPALSNMTRHGQDARERWLASEFALSQLELIGVTSTLQPQLSEGAWEETWRWRATVTPYQDPLAGADTAGLFLVELEVRDWASDRILATLTTLKRQNPVP